MKSPVLRILFAAPAWWPASAFGGPVSVGRALVSELVEQGHHVDVVTTTLEDAHTGRSLRSHRDRVDGVDVHYLATPIRYRWMGITPSLPLDLARLPRPDVVHVYGFRDPVTTAAAAWCAVRGIPYVFEPLGMFEARLRKVRLKTALDRSLYRHVPRGAAAATAVSEREARDLAGGGVPPARIHVRGNPFPTPRPGATGALRGRLGLAPDVPLVLYVGRIAAGKGVELLLDAVRALPGVHLALVGPDDRHGIAEVARAAAASPDAAGRVHLVGPVGDPLPLYGDADVFALPSTGESFGMVAAEAASAGVPVIVTDRCGVSEFLDGAAVVVPYDGEALRRALAELLDDPERRARLGAAGLDASRRWSAAAVAERQLAIYRAALGARG